MRWILKLIEPAFICSKASAAFSFMFADILMFLDNILFPEYSSDRSNAIEVLVTTGKLSLSIF